jgi:hypothetical protein
MEIVKLFSLSLCYQILADIVKLIKLKNDDYILQSRLLAAAAAAALCSSRSTIN